MRGSSSGLLTRVVAAVAVLALVGLVLKLVVAILQPILPPTFSDSLSEGWNYLFLLVRPAIGPIGALAILALLIWILIGRR